MRSKKTTAPKPTVTGPPCDWPGCQRDAIFISLKPDHRTCEKRRCHEHRHADNRMMA